MIIAIKEKDRAVIGYSNRDLWYHLQNEDHVDEENVAIRHTENGSLFACSYTDRAADTILYDKELLSTEVNMKSLVRDIIPYLKENLDASHCIKDGSFGNTLIIYQDGNLYDISPTFSVTEVDDYICHSFKSSALMGVLDLTKGMNARERIFEAFSFMSKEFNENLFPMVITDTKTKKIEPIYKGGSQWTL